MTVFKAGASGQLCRISEKRKKKFSWAYEDRSQMDDHVAHARELEYKNNTHYSSLHYIFFPSSLRPSTLASHASRSSHVPSATSALSTGAPSSLVVTPGLCRPHTRSAKLLVALQVRWWQGVGGYSAPGGDRWWLCPRRSCPKRRRVTGGYSECSQVPLVPRRWCLKERRKCGKFLDKFLSQWNNSEDNFFQLEGRL